MAQVRDAKRTDSRYFTMAEQKETVGKEVYNAYAPREKRPLYKFKSSGATYEGEWKGGFRDGTGE